MFTEKRRKIDDLRGVQYMPLVFLSIFFLCLFSGSANSGNFPQMRPVVSETSTAYIAESDRRLSSLESRITALEDRAAADRIVQEVRLKKELEALGVQAVADVMRAEHAEQVISGSVEKIIGEYDKELEKKISDHELTVRDHLSSVSSMVVASVSLLVAVVAFVGFGGVFYLRKVTNSYVKKRVQLVIDSKSLLVQMQVATHEGYQQFLDYVEAGKKQTWQLRSAIRKTRWAIEEAKKFSRKKKKALSAEDKRGLHYAVLGQAKNNLCYYLAMLQSSASEEERDEALGYAEQLYQDVLERYADVTKVAETELAAEWLETYAFALFNLGDEVQKVKACAVVKALIANPHLPTKWRELIRSDWEGVCPEESEGSQGAAENGTP